MALAMKGPKIRSYPTYYLKAIHMMAFLLKRTLGLVEERWNEIVAEIHSTADKLLTTPELDFDNWLERLTWFENLKESNMKLLKNILVKDLSAAAETGMKTFESGQEIHLKGRQLAFVKKGICKVTEGRIDGSCHNFYVHQGEIMGPRNFLLFHMNKKPKEDRVWPQFLPCRRYMANTRVEICFLGESTLAAALKVPQVYAAIANYVQKKRIVAEVLHYDPSQDLTIENCLDKKRAKFFISCKEETLITIRENRVAFIGCWTHLVAVKLKSCLQEDRKEEINPLNTCHIVGPAEFIVAPVDSETEALVYLVPRKFDRDIYTDYSNVEKSNYSLMDQRKWRMPSAQLVDV